MDFRKRLSETTTDTSETTEAVTEETPAQEEPTENLVAIGDTITTDYPLFIEIQPAGTTDIYKLIIR